MSAFLKKCLWFLIVVIVLNILYVFLLLGFSPAFQKTYAISTFKGKNYDLLILGNSMALDGIDAEYLTKEGVNSYNLALAGDHISTSSAILEDYLKDNAPPKTVMIGLSSAIGRGYLNKIPFKNPEVEFFYNPDLWTNIKNPPLLNFQWLAVDMLKIIVSKDHRNAELILGQWRTSKVIPDHSVYAKPNYPKLEYNSPYLKQIIEKCESRGINVILVELPAANKNQNSLPFEYDVKFGNKIKKVYNLNNQAIASKLINPSTDWLAPDHLNERGAAKVTQYLLKNVIHVKANDSILGKKL